MLDRLVTATKTDVRGSSNLTVFRIKEYFKLRIQNAEFYYQLHLTPTTNDVKRKFLQ